jgi:hypothetical protein
MRPLWRPRHGWENNIKMNFKGIECKDVDLIKLVHDKVLLMALVNNAMNLKKNPAW